MLVLTLVLFALTLALVVVTVLPFSQDPAWWIRIWDFPRLQIAVAAVVVMLGFAAVMAAEPGPTPALWLSVAALALVVGYQGMRMIPYAPFWKSQSVRADDLPGAASAPRLRLLVSNVLMKNREAQKWLDVVRAADADVMLAVETDHWWDEQTRVLEEDYPHHVRVPIDNTYGMLLYSRLPLENPRVRYVVEDEVPSIWTAATIGEGDDRRRVNLVLIHPRPPRPDIQQDSDTRDAELVLVAREVEKLDRPVIVAGDLNDVAWSRTSRLFQKISELLDPRIGRGLYSSFHAEYPFLRWPLDHVFHSEELALVEMRRLGYVGSDHFPILVELAATPQAARVQDTPHADAEDQETADEMVEEGLGHTGKQRDR
jgi:endonuclease/exonuclease/phosphatase (EEP) superfamily protein YafD